MDIDDFGRNIILASLEPAGEPWLEMSYEEGLTEIDDFFPSPDLKLASSAVLPSYGEQTKGLKSAGIDDDLDGLMEDLDAIEGLNGGGTTVRDDDDVAMQDNNMTNAGESDMDMTDVFRAHSHTTHPDEEGEAPGLAASLCTDGKDSPTASAIQSPQLPTVQDLNESTRSQLSDGRSIDRSSVALPSSERRASMWKEMQQEDDDAADAAREPVLPIIPTLKGLGLNKAVTDDTPKTLEDTSSIRARSVPALETAGEQLRNFAEGSLTVPSSPSLQKRGRKHARAPSNSLEEDVGCDTAPPSPTRPMAKKPRRRGRTNSQSELHVNSEAIASGSDAAKHHIGDSMPQSSTSMNLNESDSSLTDLSLNSSILPSGESWDFAGLDKTSRPTSDHEDEMKVDQEADNSRPAPEQGENNDLRDDPIPFNPTVLAHKDSLMEPDHELLPDESPTTNTVEPTPTKSNPEPKQMAPSTAKSAAAPHTSDPAPHSTRSRRPSRPPPTTKPQSREVAALAGILGINGDKTENSPRKTRGQKKAVEMASPNAGKAAKKRHTGTVDYSKML